MQLGNRRGKVEGSALNPGSGTVSYMFHEMPLQDRTLTAIWNNALKKGGDNEFLIYEGKQRFSYNDVEKIINKWERIVSSYGLPADATVAVMMSNSPDFIGIYFGLARLGLKSVPINTAHTGQMLEYVLTDSRADMAIVDADLVANFDPKWDLPNFKSIVIVGDKAEADQKAAAKWPYQYAGDLADKTGNAEVARRDPAPADVASVLYTSGTTGPAKGVVQQHEYFAFYGWAFAHQIAYTPADTLMTGLPLFHVNAQCASMLPALLSGAKLALYKKFSATRFWDHIVETGATQFAGMGAMANILMKRDESEYRPEHKLRICQLVPAPDHLEEFERRFKVPVVYQMHGMTEGMFILPTHYPERTPGRVGQESPYHQFQIVDDEDREVGVGEEGELVVRPLLPNIIAREYLGKPEATLKTMSNLWFHTGDTLYRDENGDLWFAGRKKDSIRRRGENISAFEVEREVLAHDLVMEVAAVAVPSELGEDEVKIAVVPKPGLTEAALHEFCKERMASFMVPRYIEFLDELPKNMSQKILKNELKAAGITPNTWDSEAAKDKPKTSAA